MPDHSRTRWTWYGLAFGVVLFVSAFGSAGGGHGSYLPFTIFAAPLSLVPMFGLFAAPVWWGFIGWLLKSRRHSLAIVALAVHTVTVGVVLSLGNPAEHGDEQWRYFAQVERIMPLWLWCGLVIYAAGLLIAWALAIGPLTITRRAEPTSR